MIWNWLNTNTGSITAIATVISGIATVVLAIITFFYAKYTNSYVEYTKKLLNAQEEILNIQRNPNLIFTQDSFGYSCLYNLSSSTILIHGVKIKYPINEKYLEEKCYCANPAELNINNGYAIDPKQDFEKYIIISGDYIRLHRDHQISDSPAPYGTAIKFHEKNIVTVRFSYANTGAKVHELPLTAISRS